jgi:hypothetical protein
MSKDNAKNENVYLDECLSIHISSSDPCSCSTFFQKCKFLETEPPKSPFNHPGNNCISHSNDDIGQYVLPTKA